MTGHPHDRSSATGHSIIGECELEVEGASIGDVLEGPDIGISVGRLVSSFVDRFFTRLVEFSAGGSGDKLVGPSTGRFEGKFIVRLVGRGVCIGCPLGCFAQMKAIGFFVGLLV